ncbi:MAG: Carboxylesterase type [Gemmatimonadetes bacterium]|nr:Carboxylesterase type [Gemmatimonadota bacterium]
MRLTRIAIVCAALAACSKNPSIAGGVTSKGLTVTTDAGALSGAVDSSGVLVFRGIPYAAPPVGDLRWRPPMPAAHWSGTRAANRLGKNCVQDQIYSDIDPFAAGISEDCLYLNVWTTDLNSATRKPVMVWIYGGGYNAGFGDEARHYGAHLAQKGAVVVTLNYRLGVFGFFAHPALAAESPNASAGNYAILDQIAALKWVRDNIAQFGGDPSRVMIFGESAGGSSVGSLMASPLAKGLFHRAILQSGNAIGSLRSKDFVYAEGVRFATLVGAPTVDVATIARLRAIPTDSLMRASRPSDGKSGFNFVFNPRLVRDGWVLPLGVDSALVRGTANIVPVIVGATGDEGDAAYASARAFTRLVTAQRVPAYLYLFTRVGDDSVNKKRGAYHSADITFSFGIPRPVIASAGSTSYDAALADAMSDYWFSFAATGNPNNGKRPNWPVYDATTDAYMELGPRVVAKSALRRAVYDSIDAAGRLRGDVRP